MKNTILVPDFNIALVKTVIALREEDTMVHKVLAEMYRLSENGQVEQYSTLGDHMMKVLGVSATNYRGIIHKLIKSELIFKKKEEDFITLCLELQQKVTGTTITTLGAEINFKSRKDVPMSNKTNRKANLILNPIP